MKESKKFNPDKIRIELIRLVSETIHAPLELVQNETPPLAISNKLIFGFNLETKTIKLDHTVTINCVAEKEYEILRSNYNFFYSVDNLPEIMETVDKENVSLPQILADTLAMISYSTIRGLVYTKLKDTPFDSFILPVLSPDKLMSRIPGDVE